MRQLQKLDTFYNGMYRYLHYEHLPKDKLLARKIKSNKNRYIVDNELIYHLWNKRLNSHIYKQLCIPRELRPKISVSFMIQISQVIRVHIRCMKMQFDIFGGIICIRTYKIMYQVVSYA